MFRPVRAVSASACRRSSRATAAPTVPSPAMPTRNVSDMSFFSEGYAKPRRAAPSAPRLVPDSGGGIKEAKHLFSGR